MKQSAPSSISRDRTGPPEQGPVFFVDRSLGGKVVPTLLKAAGWNIERHDDHFPQNTPDTEWINTVGQRGWIILTADERIRYKPTEKQALLDSNTLTFLLSSRNGMKGSEMADVFIRARSRILKAIQRQKPPAIFKVHGGDAGVECWLTG